MAKIYEFTLLKDCPHCGAPLAGVLLISYGLWTAFAAVLNFAIWRLNAGA